MEPEPLFSFLLRNKRAENFFSNSYFVIFFLTHGTSSARDGSWIRKNEKFIYISRALCRTFFLFSATRTPTHMRQSRRCDCRKKTRLRRVECGSLISEIFSRVAHMAECALTSRRSRFECVYVLFPDFFPSVLRVARRFFFRYNGVSISLDPFFMKLECEKTVSGKGNDWWIREKRKRKSLFFTFWLKFSRANRGIYNLFYWTFDIHISWFKDTNLEKC